MLVLQTRGRGFESPRPYHINKSKKSKKEQKAKKTC
ncbi:hypothetical protein GvMRE_I2g645 [endosymbiont GvMRE of Glomus versiforme]|nr:hypothetical protein GvMRE_I2g645 [endosymbiont GvMRE of Glomus versiforme]